MKLSATLLLACHLASWAAAAPAPSQQQHQQHEAAPSRRDPAAAASDPELVLSIVEAAAAAAVAAPPSSTSSSQQLAPSSTSDDSSPRIAESPATTAAGAGAVTSAMEAPGSLGGAPCAGSGSTYHRLRHYVDLIVVVFVAGFLVLFVVAEIGLTLYNKYVVLFFSPLHLSKLLSLSIESSHKPRNPPPLSHISRSTPQSVPD